ncbi:armadillo-type protein [Ostreococcus tauri]|uniref:Armadillo-type protein n=1 Tax=Ostreococcus tauri TaxID=70448 RepID=A0A1Y5IIE9_OSTTA|nr:armadillo-type protein [Ostreococcus tauri]
MADDAVTDDEAVAATSNEILSASPLDSLVEIERFVDVVETTLADDYSSDVQGSTALDIAAKYCRDCHVSSQRLYHVNALSKVCEGLDDEHAFPVDLIAELAEDDDNEVRRSVAAQLDRFASCLGRLSSRLDTVNAIKLLGVMFMLIEDDCEDVIEAAESTCGAVAALLSSEKQRSLLISTLKSFGESEEEEIRISAAKTLGRLSEVVGLEITKSEVLPCLLDLARDEEFRVREAVASALSDTFEVLGARDTLDLVYPEFMFLSRDAIWAVRAACARNIVHLVKAVPSDMMLQVASEAFEPLANDVSFKVRSSAFEQLGPLIFALSSVEVPSIFVDYFTSMAESSTVNGALHETCAYNLPAVALSLTEVRWGEIRQTFGLLASSLNWRVRRTLACSLHEVAKIIGRGNSEKDLLPILEKILEDTDEVKIGVIEHLSEVCNVIGSAARLSLIRLLSSMHSEDTENIGNWRIRFALAEQILPIAESLSGAASAEFLFPILLSFLHDAASVVREKAVEITGRVLFIAAKDLTWYSESIVNALSSIKLLATSHRWSDRRAYVNICLTLTREVEQRFIVDELLPLLVMLAEDTAAVVRVALCHFLYETLRLDPTYASLPDISAALSILKIDEEATVRAAAERAEAGSNSKPGETSEGFTSACELQFSPTGL